MSGWVHCCQTLAGTVANSGAIWIALRDRVSGRLVGFALGSALENHNEEGVESDPRFDDHDTFYLQALATLPWPLWLSSVAIFVIAWIGQFIGHAIEGRRPSFFKDLQFLLIGPLWLVAAAYRRLIVPY